MDKTFRITSKRLIPTFGHTWEDIQLLLEQLKKATEYDIAAIIDVSPLTANRYVHHGTKLTERWRERTA